MSDMKVFFAKHKDINITGTPNAKLAFDAYQLFMPQTEVLEFSQTDGLKSIIIAVPN
jgi:hypothetical protein